MKNKSVFKIGFIGVGTMATAIVRSLLNFGTREMRIYLSPRSKVNTQQLAAEADYVEVMDSNQDVLNQADWIVLAVTPQVAADVLSQLKFERRHHLISLISPISLKKTRAMLPEWLPINKVIPLPFIQYGKGPILLHPYHKGVVDIFDELGKLVVVETEYQLDVLITVTALVSPFLRVLSETVRWGAEHDLTLQKSADYTLAFFDALVDMAKRRDINELLDLWREMTPGGLNQKATLSLENKDGFSIWSDALDTVLKFFTADDLKD
ncbi:MAG TPA: NAD(P)-binding domain-containing protein [Clostridiaceae bacterium]|nr:NAD(P)-binding domain-containing protein [Clostridiaceae bacterium]